MLQISDWSETPGWAAVWFCVAMGGIASFHCVMFGLFKLRVLIYSRCIKSNKVSDSLYTYKQKSMTLSKIWRMCIKPFSRASVVTTLNIYLKRVIEWHLLLNVLVKCSNEAPKPCTQTGWLWPSGSLGKLSMHSGWMHREPGQGLLGSLFCTSS